MRYINLTRDRRAIVDDEDYGLVRKHKWHFSGKYAEREEREEGKRVGWIRMHRVIMKTPDDMRCDHINGNSLDNRKANLRNCTQQQNSFNRRKNLKGGTSPYKGVDRIIRNGKNVYWRAKIRHNGIQMTIGLFHVERHAALAYDMWAKSLFGEYAWTNFTGVSQKEGRG
jgi:hypothetical protein